VAINATKSGIVIADRTVCQGDDLREQRRVAAHPPRSSRPSFNVPFRAAG
jgi:hypothetical protein